MMKTASIAAAALSLSIGVSSLHAQTVSPRVFSPGSDSPYAPAVDVWLDQVSYDYGDRIRPYFVTEPDAYVTIVRVTSDGTLRVLYPRRPGLQRPYRDGELAGDRLPYAADNSFNLHESGGTGFIFAIASFERFDFRYYTQGGDWSMTRLATVARNSDPFEIVRRFVSGTLNDRAEYSLDYETYDIRSTYRRSRYASRYLNYGFEEYYGLCMSAFGFGYSNYCGRYRNSAYGGYYGPYIYVNNQPGTPAGKRLPRIKPVVPDPLLPTGPTEPEALQGRLADRDPSEAAALSRHERMLRSARPRIEMKANSAPEAARAERAPGIIYRDPGVSRPAPRNDSPRYEPQRSEPQRSEPRRVEPQRAEPRVQAPARAEPRVERAQMPAARIEAPRAERPQKDTQDKQ